MKHSKLRSDYLEHRSEENRLAYKKKRNFCVTLLRKKKGDYFNNLDLNLVRDKIFLIKKTCNPKKKGQKLRY